MKDVPKELEQAVAERKASPVSDAELERHVSGGSDKPDYYEWGKDKQ